MHQFLLKLLKIICHFLNIFLHLDIFSWLFFPCVDCNAALETLWSKSFDVSSSAGVQFPVLGLKKEKLFFSFNTAFRKKEFFFNHPSLLTKIFPLFL